MNSRRVLSSCACAVLLAAAGAYLLRRSALPAARWVESAGLRDAPNDLPADDLAGRHERLARDGQSACALCHLPHRTAGGTASWGAARSLALQAGADLGSGPTDYRAPTSALCLSCHDGALGGGYMVAFAQIKGNHPIGADYLAVALGRPADYRAPDGGSVRLENGKVGCLSCHRLHGPAGPDARSGVPRNVCLNCHRS